MSTVSTLPHGVMEGRGSYNKNATRLASGAALAIPLLEAAIRRVSIENEISPIVIADYGSSQGKNSLDPMSVAIRNFRSRTWPDRAIWVFHVDQPSNDFASLFEVLHSDPNRYTRNDLNVFPCAIGRSFYEQVLPANSVHLAWSSYAAVWLRRPPCLIPGHFFPTFAKGEVRSAFERQAAEDWKAFLAARETEMLPGARLVVVLPALADEKSGGFTEVLDQANIVLAEMVEEGSITAEERARMVLASYPRREEELLAPFTDQSKYQRLVLEDFQVSELPDPAWEVYQQDRDAESLAVKQALFVRAVFMASLASFLTQVRAGDSAAQNSFIDRLQTGLVQRLLRLEAMPTPNLVQTIVLAKVS